MRNITMNEGEKHMGTKIMYNHKAIEKKWREKWAENSVNPRVDDNGNKKQKYYCLDMFPYPSGNGLHVGHWRGYVISDVWSRYGSISGCPGRREKPRREGHGRPYPKPTLVVR